MSDPRHGVPSCSQLYRLENCPASFFAEKLFPEAESADAKAGTRIHAALERGDVCGLSREEAEVYSRCKAQEAKVLSDWLIKNDAPTYRETRELRLGVTYWGSGVIANTEFQGEIITGQADVIYQADNGSLLIIDYKSGRGEVEGAEVNRQLRGLAVLGYVVYGAVSVRVAILQPLIGKPSVADFDEETLVWAHGWLLGVLDKVEKSTPEDTRAGDWCQHCRAKEACPAFNQVTEAPVQQLAIALPTNKKEAKLELFERVFALPFNELAESYDRLNLLSWFAEAIKAAMRRKIAACEAPGYAFKKGNSVESINDLPLVWSRLEALGVSGEQFSDACKLSKKAVTDMVEQKTGLKGKALADKVKEIVAGATVAKQNQDGIEKV